MKIAACYITKNEEKNLPKSLASIKKLADEIIVGDTGSSDRTKELAAAAGAKVIDLDWQDDFAAARNAVLQATKADWIIFLDADEYFSGAGVAKLRSYLSDEAEGLLMQMVNLDESSGEILDRFYTVRVFKRQGAVYQGAIHEQLLMQGQPLQHLVTVPAEEVTIYHTGYSKEKFQAKCERNIRLLEKALAAKTQQPEELYMSLAEAYAGIGNRQQALHYARLDVATGRKKVTYASRSYRLLLAEMAKEKGNPAARRKLAFQAVRDFPELPEFHAEYAECLMYGLDYRQAAVELQQALQAYEHYASLEPTFFTAAMAEQVKQRLSLWQKIIDRREKLTISACVITKNEAKDIAKWLQSAKEYSDEIIFVDTGSSDGTIELAEAAGVKVQHFSWQDNFAAARNYAVSQATGEWIAFFDGDEYLEDAAKLRDLVAEIEVLQPATEAVALQLINVDADANNLEINRCSVARLFRRRQDICYEGAIHEQLVKTEGKLDVYVEEGRLQIIHTGYSSGRVMKKIKRDLQLLQDEIQKYGEGPQHYRYLADCYYALKDFAKTFHYAALAIEHEENKNVVGGSSDMYHRLIAAARGLNLKATDILPLVGNAIERYPKMPDFYAELGKIYLETGAVKDAYAPLKKALELAEDPQADRQNSMIMGEIDIIASLLAKSAAFCGDELLAERALQKAFASNKYCSEGLQLLADKYSDEPKAFAEFLQGYYEETAADCRYLTRWAGLKGCGSIYGYYAEKLQQLYQEKDALFPYYQLAKAEKWAELSALTLQDGSTAMQQYFIAVLKNIRTEEGPQSLAWQEDYQLLPETLQHILLSLTGDVSQLTADDEGSYRSMLPMVCRYGDEGQRTGYFNLAELFGEKTVWWLGSRLLSERRWQEALQVYGKIAADSPLVTGDFWCHVGMALWGTGQEEAAAEAWQRARDMDCSLPELAAYETWFKERRAQ